MDFSGGGIHIASEIEKKEEEPRIFRLPPRASNNLRITKYLTDDRGLKKQTVDKFIRDGLIYEEATHHNLVFIVLGVIIPVTLAVMISQLHSKRKSKAYQTMMFFPHFLSWVIIASIITNVLSYDGLVNSAIELMGGEYVNFIGNSKLFVPLVYITEVWKGAGWSSIIYMAAIAGIDQEQFEAADIDGASRWDKMWRITLPSILPTITIMFILAAGNVMTKGFDQVFNMANAAVHKVSQTLDMYIYNVTFNAKKTDFGYSTAISMFRSVVNLGFLVIANTITKKLGGNGLMGGGD